MLMSHKRVIESLVRSYSFMTATAVARVPFRIEYVSPKDSPWPSRQNDKYEMGLGLYPYSPTFEAPPIRCNFK